MVKKKNSGKKVAMWLQSQENKRLAIIVFEKVTTYTVKSAEAVEKLLNVVFKIVSKSSES